LHEHVPQQLLKSHRLSKSQVKGQPSRSRVIFAFLVCVILLQCDWLHADSTWHWARLQSFVLWCAVRFVLRL